MAPTDSQRTHRTAEEEAQDHVGSGASTPPGGTATPRPDLHNDKRFPGIVNSYFGQVRPSSLYTSVPHFCTFPASSQGSNVRLRDKDMASYATHPQPLPSPASETSQTGLDGELLESAPLLPHEKDHSIMPSQDVYPTPPQSKSSSVHAPSRDEPQISSTSGQDSPSRKRSFDESRPSPTPPPPSQLRRGTLTSPLPSVVTQSPAASAEISNPTSDASADASPSLAASAPSAPADGKENQKLTEGAERHKQNTPPQTPRSGSHESRRGEDAAAVQKSSRSDSGGSTEVVPVGQQKGQLEVHVEEGRGLRPSVQPYIVCVFQQNEDVSSGPKEDEMDTAVEDGQHDDENLAKGVAMRRMGSGSGTPRAIPGMGSRQTSQTNIADLKKQSRPDETTDPIWKHTATFDVVGEQNELDVSVYDNSNNETFLGHVRVPINLADYEHQHEAWFKLEGDDSQQGRVTGEIRLTLAFHQTGKKNFGPDDFEILKLIGKGTFGQVFQVRKKDTKRIYAMKVLSKKVIVQKKEIQHTIGERNILVRTASTESPFIVGLKFSFQTQADLYLVTDYMSGGELFWHLQKEGRFLEDRAKFYIAELILALRHLHQHDIVYRDLKPENILLDANGHIALCDFGLSKANLAKDDTTNTFCGTTEYLAPEVLLDEQGYTKMVDFWSLGVLVFEMCCGWSPFYAEDTQQMYKNIAFGKVRFPRDALSNEGRNFVKGLLNRNPAHRLGAKGDAEELMAHAFFNDVDWSKLSKKMLSPPFKPKLKGELDTSNFDPEFTNALSGANPSSLNARAAALASGIGNDSTPLSPTMQNQFKGFTFVDESTLDHQFGGRADLASPTEEKTFDKSNRMSGVEATGEQEHFNHGMLDDI